MIDVRYFEVTEAMLDSARQTTGEAERAACEHARLPIGLPDAVRTTWVTRFNDLPVMCHLGARLQLEDDTRICVVVPRLEPYHLGGMGGATMNGGVISAMFDCALGVAGVLQNPDRTSGTVQLEIKLMRPVSEPRVACYAWALRATRACVFTEAELYDGRNRLCAVGSGIVAVG